MVSDTSVDRLDARSRSSGVRRRLPVLSGELRRADGEPVLTGVTMIAASLSAASSTMLVG